ncbi:cytochrome c-type biogenesis protein CcmH [Catenovulum sp. SM1970]|nr:cytochrome c-type biogenesis protein [Marinifaba aquimaris]NTS76360.1 cytochrome c-type biogenesis protein CcmH [Marinifaba aquimaris]
MTFSSFVANANQQQAAEEVVEHYPFQSKDKEAMFLQLTKELRCPKCQNQNIADSNAGVAMDLKNKTYQLVQEGKSKQDVIDYMIQRYGNFVHYQPPMNWLTIWLWLLPISLVSALAYGLIKRKQVNESKPAAEDRPQQNADLLAQAEQILASKQSANKEPRE